MYRFQQLGELLSGLSGWFREFSSVLLPAERRGRSSFGCSSSAEARRDVEFELSWASRVERLGIELSLVGMSGPASAGLSLSLLFDNCIGRKRDVGGVVLAGALA
jgi:hypothetical protein